MPRAARWGRCAALAAFALAAAGAAPLRADPGCPAASPLSTQPWPAPLDRAVSLQARDLSLRSALDRVAAAAGVDVAYSADLLPLDRPVCVSRRQAPLGDVLRDLLRGTAAEPVSAGPGHVVLAPSPKTPSTEMSPTPVALDRIVVTGTPGGATERSLPLAVDVLSRTRLAAMGSGTLSQALDALVPGMWAWEQSPGSLGVRYGSIRGASSFGVSYPKVYIDGVEVADPLLVSRFGLESVDRIEVIRGPQGAALYGTDAISGVINVVTRHDGADAGAGHLSLRTEVGSASSRFGASRSLSQEHELAARFGSGTRSAGLSLSGGSVGAFVPDGAERHLIATGTGRLVGERAITTATLRFSAQGAGAPQSPVPGDSALRGAYGAGPSPMGTSVTQASGGQSARQYTAGLTTTYTPDGRWTHTLVAGVDGAWLRGVRMDSSRPWAVDAAALGAADGGADRGTLRASSVARLGTPAGTSATLSLTGEHSVLRETFARRSGVRGAGWTGGAVLWQQATAAVVQGNVGLGDALFVTAGVRGERNDALTGSARYAALPLLGAALVQERGDVRVKLRAAYGTGTRPPRTAPRDAGWTGARAQEAASALAAERQSGVEAGADVFVGRSLTFRVTRFDQVASGLIQRVALQPGYLVGDSAAGVPDQGRRIAYQLQNVGRISNRGWEMQGTAELGSLSLAGAVSTVDSRVRRVATGYTGELRPGDRALEVPAWTAGLTASWAGAGWSASGTAYRAGSWVGYDYVALARGAADAERPDRDFTGAGLRAYWHTYAGVTHLRANATHDLPRGFTLVLSGDNLLGTQSGEPDNATVLPGRTLTVGFRAQF